MAKKLAIHHTAVSRNEMYPQLYGVNNYHKDRWWMRSSLGWYIGYNYFCDVQGKETQTRRIDEEQVAQRGHNCDAPERCDTISYCFAMDGEREYLSDAQIKTFRKFWQKMRYKYPGIEITFHRDLQQGRTCPGRLITKKYIESILQPKDNRDDEERKKRIALLKQQVSLLQRLLELLRRLA